MITKASSKVTSLAALALALAACGTPTPCLVDPMFPDRCWHREGNSMVFEQDRSPAGAQPKASREEPATSNGNGNNGFGNGGNDGSPGRSNKQDRTR